MSHLPAVLGVQQFVVVSQLHYASFLWGQSRELKDSVKHVLEGAV